MKKLTAANVYETFRSCLFNEGEDTTNAVMAEGVVRTFGFHPERLEKAKGDIIDYLSQLPHQFRTDGGGGWSFLNAVMTDKWEQWGEQYNAEQLMALGCAIGKVRSMFPRIFWPSLPGSVPFYLINLKEDDTSKEECND